MDDASDRVRVDKWLWAARFYKTRTLASDAVKGGLVQLDGKRVKASRDVSPGNRLEITIGQSRRTVVVLDVSGRRGPASEAQKLYEETPESVDAREQLAAQRRLSPVLGADLAGRPTKRDRRRLQASRGARRGRS